MKITDQCVVALTWTLKDTLGETLDILDEPVEFLVGGDDLLDKIDADLQGHVAGDELAMQLEPEDAFGDYNDQLVFLEARNLFPAELEEGMVFEGLPPGGSSDAPADLLYFVTEIYPEHVVLDANHPLAGFAIRLELKVHAVREATLDELAGARWGQVFSACKPMPGIQPTQKMQMTRTHLITTDTPHICTEKSLCRLMALNSALLNLN
jgi:FKBP-type peptidyl-prolyl cis-trans isomerase SlyD